MFIMPELSKTDIVTFDTQEVDSLHGIVVDPDIGRGKCEVLTPEGDIVKTGIHNLTQHEIQEGGSNITEDHLENILEDDFSKLRTRFGLDCPHCGEPVLTKREFRELFGKELIRQSLGKGPVGIAPIESPAEQLGVPEEVEWAAKLWRRDSSVEASSYLESEYRNAKGEELGDIIHTKCNRKIPTLLDLAKTKDERIAKGLDIFRKEINDRTPLHIFSEGEEQLVGEFVEDINEAIEELDIEEVMKKADDDIEESKKTQERLRGSEQSPEEAKRNEEEKRKEVKELTEEIKTEIEEVQEFKNEIERQEAETEDFDPLSRSEPSPEQEKKIEEEVRKEVEELKKKIEESQGYKNEKERQGVETEDFDPLRSRSLKKSEKNEAETVQKEKEHQHSY